MKYLRDWINTNILHNKWGSDRRAVRSVTPNPEGSIPSYPTRHSSVNANTPWEILDSCPKNSGKIPAMSFWVSWAIGGPPDCSSGPSSACRFEPYLAHNILTGCIADGYTTVFWRHRSAGSNPATQTIAFIPDVGIRVGLRPSFSSVRFRLKAQLLANKERNRSRTQ